jgi:hypothetical protein
MCRSSLRKGTVIYSVWKVLGAHDLRWIFCSLYGSMISVSTRDFHRHSRPNGQSSAAAPKDVCLWHVSAVLRTGLGQSGKRRWASSVLQRRPVSCHGWEGQTDARARPNKAVFSVPRLSLSFRSLSRSFRCPNGWSYTNS